MFTKKWSERSSGNEHCEHEKLSSLSKRAKLRGPCFLSFFFGSLSEERRPENRCLKRWKVRRPVKFFLYGLYCLCWIQGAQLVFPPPNSDSVPCSCPICVLSSGLDYSAWFHFPRSETVTGGTETGRIAQWDSWNARKFHFSIETFRCVHVFHGEPHDREAC